MKQSRSNIIPVKMDQNEFLAIKTISKKHNYGMSNFLRKCALRGYTDNSVVIRSDDIVNFYLAETDIINSVSTYENTLINTAPLLAPYTEKLEAAKSDLITQRDRIYQLVEDRRIKIRKLATRKICKKQLEAYDRTPKGGVYRQLDVKASDEEYINLLDLGKEEDLPQIMKRAVIGSCVVKDYVVNCYSVDSLLESVRKTKAFVDVIITQSVTHPGESDIENLTTPHSACQRADGLHDFERAEGNEKGDQQDHPQRDRKERSKRRKERY